MQVSNRNFRQFYKRLKQLKPMVLFAVAIAAGVGLSTALGVQAAISERGLSGGATTTFNRTSSSYEEAAPNLTTWGELEHEEGDEAFEEAFVATSGHQNSGLGPNFNNVSCESCHIRNGRGMPEPGQLLVRVSAPTIGIGDASKEASADNALAAITNMPEFPGLGNQIQDFAIYGQQSEAAVEILWQETAGAYEDGEPYRLRQPQFDITLDNGETLVEGTPISPRIPPQVYGLGLLEAIDEADILALADPEDANGDGISGKPNYVLNVATDELELGRFGWKSGMPNLLQQSAVAYFEDMGITNPLYPAEDGSTEIDEKTLVAAAAYAQTLAVPARVMLDDPAIQRGEQLFADANCASCHATGFRTGDHKYPSMRNQSIHPYTDMLLHDMGSGLADDRPEFQADGQEWRTPALWGIGLAQTVLPYSGYLHDGRARTFEEAILWHGGEAEQSQEAFRMMPKVDREALVKFLRSL